MKKKMSKTKYQKEKNGSILKQLFYSSDPDCYELVNKKNVSTDVESGDTEFGYDKM